MYDYLNGKLPKSFANTWNRNNDLNRRTIRNGNRVPSGRNESMKLLKDTLNLTFPLFGIKTVRRLLNHVW